MYQARRCERIINAARKSYKKARWQRMYEREANRLKIRFFLAAFGL